MTGELIYKEGNTCNVNICGYDNDLRNSFLFLKKKKENKGAFLLLYL